MSTKITPGMEGRAVRDTASMGGTKIPQSTVVTVAALPAEPHLFIGGHGKQMGMTLRVEDFVFPEVYATTPAPPLPTQASDDDGRETAPLDRAALRDALTDVDVLKRDAASGISYIDPDLAVERLADLLGMPVPEPEPEWEPETVALVAPHRRPDLATRAVRGTDDMWHNTYGGMWDDDEVSVRRLAVIDPAALQLDALADVVHDVLAGPKYKCSHAAMAVAESIEVYLSGHGYSPSRDGAR